MSTPRHDLEGDPRHLGAAGGSERERIDDDEDEDEHPRAPWHFKVLLLGTAAYLVYRLVWFVFWLTGHAWHG